jgi:cyanophycin synthetase
VSVTGTNGKTTVTRLVAHTLTAAGYTVGMTSTSGTYIGGNCICSGDNSGPRSARSLLSNKKIDAAVLETARGGIVREGLGYDLADVGIITNITDDHLGIDGIETLEDLAFVKSLVAEAVKKNGAVVLNAQDSMTPLVMKRVKTRIILFYTDEKAAEQYKSIDCDHVFTRDGYVIIEKGGKQQQLIDVNEIPITFNSQIPCNIENALAAVAALYALNIPLTIIQKGLKSFTDNHGRFNLYEQNGMYVLLDYGHNPSGYAQVIETCKNLKHSRLIGVIGMPGDRQNTAVCAVGRQCAGAFDRIYIKEDQELRGRKRGEIAALFFEEILKSEFPKKDVRIIENELEALKQAVTESQKGDLVVVLYEKLEPLQQYLQSIGAVSKIHNK